MKTVEEFIRELAESNDLMREFESLTDENEFAEFLKRYGCEASVGEFEKCLDRIYEGEMSDDEAEAAAGGRPTYFRGNINDLVRRMQLRTKK